MPPSTDQKESQRIGDAVFVLPGKTSRAIQIRQPEGAAAGPTETPKRIIDAVKQGHNSETTASPRKDTVHTNAPRSTQSQAPPTLIPAVPHLLPATNSNISTHPARGLVARGLSSSPGEKKSLDHPPFHSSQSSVAPRLPGSAMSTPSSSPRPNAGSNSTSQLDIHAKSYVPLWLRAVNDSNAFIRPQSFPKSIHFPSYIAAFAGSSFLSPIPHRQPPTINERQIVHSTSHKQLQKNLYFDYFFECLQNEISAHANQLQDLKMFNVPFHRSDLGPDFWDVGIPGLREDSPRLDIGDVVCFRQLLPVHSVRQAVTSWYAPGGGREQGLHAPGFTGDEFHAVVWGVVRAKERIVLKIENIRPNSVWMPELRANLIFVVQYHHNTSLWRAIASISEELRAPPMGFSTSDWIGKMLFPDPDHAVLQTRLSKGRFDLEWYDHELNYEQQKAIDTIVSRQYGDVPYLISGPPGTGKTKTIVEAILQLLQHPCEMATPHILVCAPSDSAADTIALRLSKHLQQKDLFRMNSWTRSSMEVPGGILGYTYMENDLFSLPDFRKFMQYKVVVCSCTDADMLVQARLTNKDMTKLALETTFSISPAAIVDMRPPTHWTALLIDEAAQATEPTALVPLSVVSTTLSTNPSEGPSFEPQFILAGDDHQLGPHLHLSNVALSTSLFERLFGRPFYAKHPLSRLNGSKPLTSKMLPIPRPAFTNLIRNYRSHPAIIAIPSLLFYKDTLIAESTYRTALSTSWSGWKKPYRWPILFIQNRGDDALEDIVNPTSGVIGSSLVNVAEAQTTVRLAKDLLEFQDSVKGGKFTTRKMALEQTEITVIAPFRAQVNMLRKIFRGKGFGQVSIGPLEAFQGLESRVVILCTTRTRLGSANDVNGLARFVAEDVAWNRGVIEQRKRFNVAMTRAKEALFVIGDERALTCSGDECWIQFLSFAGRNGAVDYLNETAQKQFKEVMKDWKNTPGRLEAGLRFGVDIGDVTGARNTVTDDVDNMPDAPRNGSIASLGDSAMASNQQLLRGLRLSDDDRMLAEGMAAERAMLTSSPATDTLSNRSNLTSPWPSKPSHPDSGPSSNNSTPPWPPRPPNSGSAPSSRNVTPSWPPILPSTSSRPNSSRGQGYQAQSPKVSEPQSLSRPTQQRPLRPPPGLPIPSNVQFFPGQQQSSEAVEFDRDPSAELEQAEDADCATQ